MKSTATSRQPCLRPSRDLAPGRTNSAVEADDSLALRLLAEARKSPAFALFNLAAAALYPHQERAFLDGLGRWPIRVLLADEVGLGKTLEAGAMIAYLTQFKAVQRVVILAPKNVLRQWQEELTGRFGLEFWIYDSASRRFVAPDGRTRAAPVASGPLGIGSPERVLVSAQLARGTR